MAKEVSEEEKKRIEEMIDSLVEKKHLKNT